MSTYVVVDLETTGLDPRQDSIIEVGAVLLQDGEVIDQLSSLINPNINIPHEITELTGIDDDMVESAPTLYRFKSELNSFIGDVPIVGHNVGFDGRFLQNEKIAVGNYQLDTLKLASILVPEAKRFNLANLVNFFALPMPADEQRHRALEDAQLTADLFLTLQQVAAKLGANILTELVEAGTNIGWPETLFFEDVLGQVIRTAFTSAPSRALKPLFLAESPKGKPLAGKPETSPLDIELIEKMMATGGNFSFAFPNYEYREQQVDMMMAVAQGLNDGQHALIEAGTGTGKSIGYLLPAAFWAVENDRTVVVSTNTINLQDQLINKDVPTLEQVLPFPINATILKGKRNYLCARSLKKLRHSGPKTDAEMILFARILSWLPNSNTGDVAELILRNAEERMTWGRLSADNDGCSRNDCKANNCPLYIARERAKRAHILIVNHALLLTDIATENKILPPFQDVIIDEAHHLESAVTNGLSFRADKRYLDAILNDLISPRHNLLKEVISTFQTHTSTEISTAIEAYANSLRDAAQQSSMRVAEFFQTLGYLVREHAHANGNFALQIRLTPEFRREPTFEDVMLSWGNLSLALTKITKAFLTIANGVGDAAESFDIANAGDLQLALSNNARDLKELNDNINTIISEPKDTFICWIESFRDRISLHAAPLHVGPLVEETIFNKKEAVIMTSATLRTAPPDGQSDPNFEYISQRIHANHATQFAVGSPFDYKNNALLFLPTDIPEPKQPGYQRYVEQAVVDVATTLGGKTLVLFTSFSQLKETGKNIKAALEKEGITLLLQTSSASRQQLTEQFKEENGRYVLLGTRSFWEGVDIAGQALQAVIITKIPFAVPSDPVVGARSETFENPFYQYSVPEAVLHFRQGFGRLIRRKTDSGVVVVLDKRVISKRYGEYFISSLADCTVLRLRLNRLAEATGRWIRHTDQLKAQEKEEDV